MTAVRWPTGSTIEPAGSSRPSIGTSAAGRPVARSLRLKATAHGRGESLWIDDERVPALVGDRPHPLHGVTTWDPQLRLEHRRAGDAPVADAGVAARVVPPIVCGDEPAQRRAAVARLDAAGRRDRRPPRLSHHAGRRPASYGRRILTSVELAVLIPVKRFRLAKRRLAGLLDDDQRVRLAQWLAERVVAAAGPLPVFVACDDEAVAVMGRHGRRRRAVDAGARSQRCRRVEPDDDLRQGLRPPA